MHFILLISISASCKCADYILSWSRMDVLFAFRISSISLCIMYLKRLSLYSRFIHSESAHSSRTTHGTRPCLNIIHIYLFFLFSVLVLLFRLFWLGVVNFKCYTRNSHNRAVWPASQQIVLVLARDWGWDIVQYIRIAWLSSDLLSLVLVWLAASFSATPNYNITITWNSDHWAYPWKLQVWHPFWIVLRKVARHEWSMLPTTQQKRDRRGG